MSRVADLLREFHRAFDVQPGALKPLAESRLRLAESEFCEVEDALDDLRRSRPANRTEGLEALANELADEVYVAYGTAELLGIDLDAALEAVHAANMAKLPDCERCEGDGSYTELAPCTTLAPDCACHGPRITVDPCGDCGGTGKGQPIKDAQGKVQKPEGWEPPNMAGAILGEDGGPSVTRSYPDAITNPLDPPTVEGTDVTRPI